MHQDIPQARSPAGAERAAPKRLRRAAYRVVMACVDGSPGGVTVVAHAASVARAVGARLAIVRVLEHARHAHSPFDPVEWEMHRREVQSALDGLAAGVDEGVRTETRVLEGVPSERISNWVRENRVDIVVVGDRSDPARSLQRLGSTARRIVETCLAAILIVPDARETPAAEGVRYRRIMVPLDSSHRAEYALPLALRIATAHGAELLLVHALQEAELVVKGAPDDEDRRLQARLAERNRDAAQAYLTRLLGRMPQSECACRIRLLEGADPRHALMNAQPDEAVDLVVLSACGFSGHRDLPIGSTADYLLSHADRPVLLVRCDTQRAQHPHEDQPVRMPGQSLP